MQTYKCGDGSDHPTLAAAQQHSSDVANQTGKIISVEAGPVVHVVRFKNLDGGKRRFAVMPAAHETCGSGYDHGACALFYEDCTKAGSYPICEHAKAYFIEVKE